LYRHVQGRWEHVTAAGEAAPGTPVAMLTGSADRLWYLSDRTVALLESGSWRTLKGVGLPDDIVLRGLAEADDGTLWLATNQGLYRGKDGMWTLSTPTLAAVDIEHLATSPQAGVWASTAMAIAHFDGSVWREYALGDDVPDASLTTLYLASDGTLWAGTAGAGLLHHNERGWSQYTSLHGLAHNHVERILETSEGALWIVTPFGLTRYTPAP
ncbi:MAG: two-component regulator propeller domain-containing protein, partial [Anaerolineae bacterium]